MFVDCTLKRINSGFLVGPGPKPNGVPGEDFPWHTHYMCSTSNYILLHL